jgi:hypothetical protein
LESAAHGRDDYETDILGERQSLKRLCEGGTLDFEPLICEWWIADGKVSCYVLDLFFLKEIGGLI